MKIYFIVLILCVIAISGCIRTDQTDKSDIDLSDILSPSEAYIVCDGQSCPNQLVTLQGKMSRGGENYGSFVITDNSKYVYINLEASDLSLIDQITFHEDFKLEKDGIIDAKVKGTLSHSRGFCTMSGCQDIVNLKIVPQDTELVSEEGCKETSPQYSTEPGDCFDVSYRIIQLEEAYRMSLSSDVCTEEGRRPDGFFKYNADEDYWVIGISDPNRPGGCTQSCLVYSDKVVFSRQCATGAFGSSAKIEETVELNSFTGTYDWCVNRNNELTNTQQTTPAKDAPVGTERTDWDGNIWVKTDELSGYTYDEQGNQIANYCWKTEASVGTCLGSVVVDTFPGGINYEPDIIDCEYYLKKTI